MKSKGLKIRSENIENEYKRNKQYKNISHNQNHNESQYDNYDIDDTFTYSKDPESMAGSNMYKRRNS